MSSSAERPAPPPGPPGSREHREPQPYCNHGRGDDKWIPDFLEILVEHPDDLRALAFVGAVVATYGTYELLVPFDWMDRGTVSDFLYRSPSASSADGGQLWPLGFGFAYPEAQFPGEAASVALADIGVLTVRHANVYGVQAGGLIAAVEDDCAGLSVGGLFAAADTIYGIQVGGLLSSCRSDIYGLQVAGYANDAPGLCAGMQAGLVNMAGNVYGAQIGFTNNASDVNGVQIGVVNVAQNMRGVQIGLVNVINDNGALPVSMLFNARF